MIILVALENESQIDISVLSNSLATIQESFYSQYCFRPSCPVSTEDPAVATTCQFWLEGVLLVSIICHQCSKYIPVPHETNYF